MFRAVEETAGWSSAQQGAVLPRERRGEREGLFEERGFFRRSAPSVSGSPGGGGTCVSGRVGRMLLFLAGSEAVAGPGALALLPDGRVRRLEGRTWLDSSDRVRRKQILTGGAAALGGEPPIPLTDFRIIAAAAHLAAHGTPAEPNREHAGMSTRKRKMWWDLKHIDPRGCGNPARLPVEILCVVCADPLSSRVLSDQLAAPGSCPDSVCTCRR